MKVSVLPAGLFNEYGLKVSPASGSYDFRASRNTSEPRLMLTDMLEGATMTGDTRTMYAHTIVCVRAFLVCKR